MDVTNAYTGLNLSMATRLSAQRQQMTDLVNQETTGLKATTYAGVQNRTLTLAFQSKLSENEAYQTTISGIDTRLSLLTNAYEAMRSTSSALSGSLDGNVYNLNSDGKTPQQATALNSLDTYVSTLNTEYGGLYLFGGQATDSPPVQSTSTILDGDASHAGYKTVASQRLQADLGSNSMGRLNSSVAGSAVSLTEDGSHVFGMKLAGVSSTLSNATVNENVSAGSTVGTLSPSICMAMGRRAVAVKATRSCQVTRSPPASPRDDRVSIRWAAMVVATGPRLRMANTSSPVSNEASGQALMGIAPR